MSFNAIPENKILSKISEFISNMYHFKTRMTSKERIHTEDKISAELSMKHFFSNLGSQILTLDRYPFYIL